MLAINSFVCSGVNYCIKLLKDVNAKYLFSKCSSAIKKSFYEQSLFFAINNQAIVEKSRQYRDLSWIQKFKLGAIKGAEKALMGYFICTCLEFALRGMPSGKLATCKTSLSIKLSAAVLEEILFRGVLQNCLAGSQKMAIAILPQCLQNNRVFKFLTSPSARIICVNSIFASLHLFNGGSYISDKGVLIQAIKIMLQPSCEILHETTGNIIAPIACHMTNNFLAHLNDLFEVYKS